MVGDLSEISKDYKTSHSEGERMKQGYNYINDYGGNSCSVQSVGSKQCQTLRGDSFPKATDLFSFFLNPFCLLKVQSLPWGDFHCGVRPACSQMLSSLNLIW